MHEEYQELITMSAYGLLDPEDEQRLREHLQECANCRREQEQVEALLTRYDKSVRAVPDELIWQSRQEWRRRQERKGGEFQRSLWGHAAGLTGGWWRQPAFSLAAAVMLLLVGLSTGYLLFSAGPAPLSPESLVAEGFAIEGVSLEEATEGERHLLVSFKASKLFQLEASKDDPGMQRLLVQALIGNANPGVRLRAVNAISSAAPLRSSDSEVIKALIGALRTDENPAVRREALQALCRYPATREVRKALVDTLLYDTNARLRIEAIDGLQKLSGQGRLDEGLAEELSKGLPGVTNELARRKTRDFLQETGYGKF